MLSEYVPLNENVVQKIELKPPEEERSIRRSSPRPRGLPEASKAFSQGGALRIHSGLWLDSAERHDPPRHRKRSHAMHLWHYVLDNLESLKQARKESRESSTSEYGLPNENKSISQGGHRRFHSGVRFATQSSDSTPVIPEAMHQEPAKSALKTKPAFSILSKPSTLSSSDKMRDSWGRSQDDLVLCQKPKTVSFLERRMSSSSSEQSVATARHKLLNSMN